MASFPLFHHTETSVAMFPTLWSLGVQVGGRDEAEAGHAPEEAAAGV